MRALRWYTDRQADALFLDHVLVLVVVAMVLVPFVGPPLRLL